MSKASCAQFVGSEWSDAVVGDVTQWDLLTYATLDNIQWHLLVGARTAEECSAQKRRAEHLTNKDFCQPNGLDILELSMCAGHDMKVAIRRRLPSGTSCDRALWIDPLSQDHRRQWEFYWASADVKLAILSPPCRRTCDVDERIQARPPSLVDYKQRWIEDLQKEVIHKQLQRERQFLYGTHERQQVNGQGVDIFQSYSNGLWLYSSCPELLHSFHCEHPWGHIPTKPRGQDAYNSSYWTRKEVAKLLDGVLAMEMADVGQRAVQFAYPQFDRSSTARAQPGVPVRGRHPQAPPRKLTTCPGCRHFRARDDWEHNRVIGDCWYPHDEPTTWECDACMRHLPRDKGHLLEAGKCKWGVVPARAYAPRSGAHPRDPARRASEEPTSRLAGAPGGDELGQQGEAALDEERREREAERTQAQKASGEREGAEPIQERSSPGAEIAPEVPDTGGAMSSVQPAPERRGRGPDQQPRVRRTWADTGVGEGQEPDWTHFDVGRAVRALRVGTEAQMRLTSRKLHLRWWHAQAATMQHGCHRGPPVQRGGSYLTNRRPVS